MILVIDNYDSFTYNLTAILKAAGESVLTVRNDEITVDEAINLHPEAVLISPGPGRPLESGICAELVVQIWDHLPVLGVCLGHQLLGELAGGKTIRARKPVHGKTDEITHTGNRLFAGITQPMKVMRYHSLILSELPQTVEVTAQTNSGEIMAICLKNKPEAEGIQFHPESILTPEGNRLITNWLNRVHNFHCRFSVKADAFFN